MSIQTKFRSSSTYINPILLSGKPIFLHVKKHVKPWQPRSLLRKHMIPEKKNQIWKIPRPLIPASSLATDPSKFFSCWLISSQSTRSSAGSAEPQSSKLWAEPRHGGVLKQNSDWICSIYQPYLSIFIHINPYLSIFIHTYLSIFIHIYPESTWINMNLLHIYPYVWFALPQMCFLMLPTNHSGRGKSFSGLKLLCQHWCKGQTAGTPRLGWTRVSCWEFPGAHINIAGTLNPSSSPSNCAIGIHSYYIAQAYIKKIYQLVMTHIAMEDHHAMKIGKPSINGPSIPWLC